MKKFILKYFNVPVLTAVLIALLLGARFLPGEAQTAPSVVLSWRAESYVPPGYVGKILPTAGSQIHASLEVFDGGRRADVSQKTILWYLNNRLIARGGGVKNVNFRAPANVPSVLELRVEIPAYGPTGLLLRTTDIPVVRPGAVIAAPTPDRTFSDRSITMNALPYFFNVKDQKDLVFSWVVNGDAPASAENPSVLTVNINPDAAPGSTLNIGLTIEQAGAERTALGAAASDGVILTFIRQ